MEGRVLAPPPVFTSVLEENEKYISKKENICIISLLFFKAFLSNFLEQSDSTMNWDLAMDILYSSLIVLF